MSSLISLKYFLVPLVIHAFFSGQSVPVYASEQIDVGTGSFIFTDTVGNPNKPITVWYYRPKELLTNSPILFVMHGCKRKSEKFRDAWIKYSEQYKVLLLAPEFSEEHYPGEQYNLGNMFLSNGKLVEESKWAFSAIEHLFDYIKSITRNRSAKYYIYGHSAGGQFVHRLVLLKPDARIQAAVAANAGWYTMPTFEVTFPYGLKESNNTPEPPNRAFGKRLIILLGEKDTDENHKYLRKTPEAMAQGKHRFERGHVFYQTAEAEAAKLGVSLKWELKTVKGAGHSNSKMAGAAAQVLFR